MKATTNHDLKTLAAALCAVTLCASLVPVLAGAGDNDAQSGEGNANKVAVPSATTTKQVGWYGTVSADGSLYDPEANQTVLVRSGYSAISSSGWVDLSGYRVSIKSDGIYVASDDLSALGSILYTDKDTSLSDVVWRPVFEEISIPDDPPEQKETPVNKEPETTLPETDRKPEESGMDDPFVLPEITQNPVDSAPESAPTPTPDESVDPFPQKFDMKEQESTSIEPEILSLQCRKSELEEKTAELEAQGYEILHIAKLPSWLR